MPTVSGEPRPRIWIDAQLPPALAAWLSYEGVEAKHVVDCGLLSADDSSIFGAAREAGVTAIMTKDHDFVRLLETLGPPPRVLLITLGNVRNADLRLIVLASWPEVRAFLASGDALIEIGRRA